MHGVDKRDNTHRHLKTIIQRRQDLRERLMNYQVRKQYRTFFLLILETSVEANMVIEKNALL